MFQFSDILYLNINILFHIIHKQKWPNSYSYSNANLKPKKNKQITNMQWHHLQMSLLTYLLMQHSECKELTASAS